jgi:adenylylsulfate kinase
MKPDHSAPIRTFIKGLSWETFSNLVCFVLAYSTFGDLGGCAVFTAIAFIVKLVLFYGHERVWHQIPFGKMKLMETTND